MEIRDLVKTHTGIQIGSGENLRSWLIMTDIRILQVPQRRRVLHHTHSAPTDNALSRAH